MRSAIAFVAATGAVAGVAAQTAAECENNWTAACDSNSLFTVDPKISHLPECTSEEQCINSGLTNCGPGIIKNVDVRGSVTSPATNTQVWLTAAGELHPFIDNDLWSTAEADVKNTCGTDAQQLSYQDPFVSVTKVAGTTELVANEYSGCYSPSTDEAASFTGTWKAAVDGNAVYPQSRPSKSYLGTSQPGSCRTTDSAGALAKNGAPTCRCSTAPKGSETKSQCKALFDAAQTATVDAARFSAFKTTVNQCTHFEPQECASKTTCRFAGPNWTKGCEDSNACRSNNDPAVDFTVEANKLVPGSAAERCTCKRSANTAVDQCNQLWADWQIEKTAHDAAGASDAVKLVFTTFDADLTRLEAAGQCTGLRPVSTTPTTATPEYSLHIGVIAGIAAGAVAFCSLLTGALICILMYACRSESHVQTTTRNQNAMNYAQGGGQSAMIYGRSGQDMEMTRRSRY